MKRNWNRMETWAALAVVALGLIPAALLGLQWYMGATAAILHPVPRDVASVTDSDPVPRWSSPAEQGRQIVRAHLAEHNLPGVSVAVGVDGAIVWAEGFGWADLESRAPITPATRFRIGTASIPLTSAAVGLLVERGGLTLDDVVPTFPENKTRVTLRQLMGHTAGIANDGGDEGPLFSQRCARPVDALQFLSGYEREPRFAPGAEYRYSSYGWIMVSAAVEAAADERFLAFMEKNVFEPLGMASTGVEATTEPTPNLATSYFPRFAADPRYGLHLMRPINLSCYSGASVFVSTPSDVVRFAMAVNGGTFLQPATVRLLQTTQRLPSGAETGYGLGWDLETVSLAGARTRWVGHDGNVLGGMVASLMTFPDQGVVVAVTSNISYADTGDLALKIAQAFAEQGRTTERK
jgi:serine beta-lactamase-like protein LACTB, mitochondrial